jgi:hypothetical protein
MSIVPTAAEQFSATPPAKPANVLLRLTDFKGARKGTWSFQLSPDGKKLAAVWVDPPRPMDYKPKFNETPSLLIVWDLSALHEVAVKVRHENLPKTLDHWVALKTQLAPNQKRTELWFQGILAGSNDGSNDHYGADQALVALSFYPKEAVPVLEKALANGHWALLRALDFFEQFPTEEARKVLDAVSAGRHGDEAAQLAKISLKKLAKLK